MGQRKDVVYEAINESLALYQRAVDTYIATGTRDALEDVNNSQRVVSARLMDEALTLNIGRQTLKKIDMSKLPPLDQETRAALDDFTGNSPERRAKLKQAIKAFGAQNLRLAEAWCSPLVLEIGHRHVEVATILTDPSQEVDGFSDRVENRRVGRRR